MTRVYKPGKIAGPSGTFSGYVLLFFGIITTIFTLTGIVVFIIGLYLSFGHYCSTIDSENRRVKKGIKLFSWAIYGRWILIDDSYKTEIRKAKRKNTVYNSSDGKPELEQADYKIYIYSTRPSKRIDIAKFKELIEAQNEMTTIREMLRLEKSQK
jgi:hypothetical protein